MSTSFFTSLRVSGLQNDRYKVISSSGMVDHPPPSEPPPTGVWRPWSDNSYLNTKIPENPKIHPDSDKMIEWFLNNPKHYGGTFQINIHSWSDPIYYADKNTPVYTVYKDNGVGIWYTNVPIPDGAVPDPMADGGFTIVDLYRNHTYGSWKMRFEGGKWKAGAFHRWDLYSSGISVNRKWTVGGASLPTLASLIRPEEIEAGVIPHVLCCGLTLPKAGWKVYPPAATTDGKSYDTWAIPEGARLQLDPNFDIDSLGLNRTGKIIVKCWQEYGIVVKECAGRSVIYAENPIGRTVSGQPDPWPALGVDGNILKGEVMKNLPWRIIDYSVFGGVLEQYP